MRRRSALPRLRPIAPNVSVSPPQRTAKQNAASKSGDAAALKIAVGTDSRATDDWAATAGTHHYPEKPTKPRMPRERSR